MNHPIGDSSVQLEIRDGIATITLNRPERRNALSIRDNEQIYDFWGRIDGDDTIRVVVLTSADCGTFCAGMDLREAAEIKAATGKDILSLLRDPMYQRMRTVRAPIIAAMTGHFTAGGMVLASHADLRVGMAGTMGGITEARVGRGSPWAVPMLWMLPQAVLLEMMLTAEMVPVERLHSLGYINYVESSPDAVRARARALAEKIRDNAPLSVLASKQAVHAGVALGANAGFTRALELFDPVYKSDDAQEGPKAFSEKRKPVWRGR